MNVHVNLMAENITQIKSGMKNWVNASAEIQEKISCAKKVIFRILVHELVKMVNV